MGKMRADLASLKKLLPKGIAIEQRGEWNSI